MNICLLRNFLSRRKRSAVPEKCAIDTLATAMPMPVCIAISGVSKLPMPKPAREAMAPAIIATIVRIISNIMSLILFQ